MWPISGTAHLAPAQAKPRDFFFRNAGYRCALSESVLVWEMLHGLLEWVTADSKDAVTSGLPVSCQPIVFLKRLVPLGMENIRTFLREHTRADHDATEAALARFDLSTYGGLRGFLTVHYWANSAIEQARNNLAWPSSLPSPPSALSSLALSMKQVGLRPAARLDAPYMAEPVGAAYVVAGSRFGNRVLKKTWQSGTDPRISSAGAYFDDQILDNYARDFMVALTDYYPTDIAAVINSARATFQTFADAAESLRENEALGI